MLTALSDLIKTIFYEWKIYLYLYLYCSWSEGGDYYYDLKNDSLYFYSWSEKHDHDREYHRDRD
tara:strand:+ start:292 stop:483 length:192 start_codon:yes stop_codon:yes gene_type:complete